MIMIMTMTMIMIASHVGDAVFNPCLKSKPSHRVTNSFPISSQPGGFWCGPFCWPFLFLANAGLTPRAPLARVLALQW
jgi:hypothetical protein